MRFTRSRRRSSVTLPWESHRGWLHDLFSGRRRRLLFVSLLTVGAVVFLWRAETERMRRRETFIHMRLIRRTLKQFHLEHGRCPESTSELLRASSLPSSAAPLRDGWGSPLHIRCQTQQDAVELCVISAGPSGSLMKDDNIY